MNNMQFVDVDGNIVAEYIDGFLHFFPLLKEVDVLEQSPQGFEGVEVIDNRFRIWTIVNRVIRVDDEPYYWGVADSYLMWDDVVWSFNAALPAPNQYVAETTDDLGEHTGWTQPMPDPRMNGGNGGNGGGDVTDTLMVRGSLSGSTFVVQGENPGFREGDGIIVPALQGRGKKGPGGQYPYRLYATETDMRNHASNVKENGICGVTETGYTWTKQGGQMVRVIDTGSWYLGFIVPRAFFATINRIDGNKWTLSKAAAIPVDNVEAYYDVSFAVMNELANADGEINLNKKFPGWKRGAVNGMLGALSLNGVTLTCDRKGSFELFSPPGTPCISLHWKGCLGCMSNFITLRGNWGDDGYGFNWADTSTNFYGYHGPVTDDNPFTPSWSTSGHEFWQCTDCFHNDADVYNVPNRATGGEGNANCWSYRITDYAEFVMRQYIQWQMQYASTVSKCGLIDCRIDSVALIPGAEIMHGHGDIVRLSGRNFQMAMNNSSGTVDSPTIALEKDCMVPLEGTPAWYQYAPGNGFGVPCINLNANAGSWAVDQGITLINPRVDQSAGWLHPNGVGLVGVEVQEKMQNFKLQGGCTFLYPEKRKQPYDKYTIGANGIKSAAKGGSFDGTLVVSGECANEANNWCVFVTDGNKGPNYRTDCPAGSVCFNWQIS